MRWHGCIDHNVGAVIMVIDDEYDFIDQYLLVCFTVLGLVDWEKTSSLMDLAQWCYKWDWVGSPGGVRYSAPYKVNRCL